MTNKAPDRLRSLGVADKPGVRLMSDYMSDDDHGDFDLDQAYNILRGMLAGAGECQKTTS